MPQSHTRANLTRCSVAPYPYPAPQPCPPCLGLAPPALTSGAPNCTSVCSTRLTGSLLRPMRVVSLPSLHVPAPPSPGAGQGEAVGVDARTFANVCTTQHCWAWANNNDFQQHKHILHCVQWLLFTSLRHLPRQRSTYKLPLFLFVPPSVSPPCWSTPASPPPSP